MKSVYLTLDYELFLGPRPGSVDNCLIKPMDALMARLEQYGARLTVFVDAAYLLRMNDLMEKGKTLQDDYKKVLEHIAAMVFRGHSIQMHFHPQWFYSDYEKGWEMDFRHYKLSDIPEQMLREKFAAAKSLLESVSGKPITAFRAGGYSLESYKNYRQLFLDNGIKSDSSVLRGAYCKTAHQVYNYRHIPSATIYNFAGSVTKEDPAGCFTEYSISTIVFSSIAYYLLKRKMCANYKPKLLYGDGQFVELSENHLKRFYNKLKKLTHKNVVCASLEGVMSGLLKEVFKACENDFVATGHPKCFSDVSLNNVEDFIQEFGPSLDFKTIA